MTDISRRRVIAGAAWATPAILIATSSPPASASGPGSAPLYPTINRREWWVESGAIASNWGTERTTGWLPTSTTDTTHATQDFTGGMALGLQSGDDNASTSDNAIVYAEWDFDVVAGETYAMPIEVGSAYGQSGVSPASSRQALVISVIADGAETVLARLTLRHQDEWGGTMKALPAGGTSDAAMVAAGYTLLSPTSWSPIHTQTLSYAAIASGQVTLRYAFTIEPVSVVPGGVSDDLWVSEPVPTRQ